jgi:hypothetical protein
VDETWAYDLESSTWTLMSPTSKPPPLSGHGLAFDPRSSRTVLFGGFTSVVSMPPVPGGTIDQTWTYDLGADTWTRVSPANAPSARASHSMVYAASIDRVLLFGGSALGGASDETWSYDVDTDTWTDLNPTVRPAPRGAAAMAYDAPSDRIVLFGGFGAPGVLGDTWTYDVESNTWSGTKSSGSRPSPRDAHAMVYDPKIDRVVLFGGRDSTLLGDTWWYDIESDAWTLRKVLASPSPRSGHAMAHDGPSGRTVLFGGIVADGVRLADTWIYEVRAAT